MASKPIVAGTDGSEESLRAVGWAAREAALRGAPLRIVGHRGAAAPDEPARGREREHVRNGDRRARQGPGPGAGHGGRTGRQGAAGVLIDTDELTGPTAQAVTAGGSGALMLVLGSRGTGAFTALVLGSVSRYAASHASSPVVVVRDETAARARIWSASASPTPRAAATRSRSRWRRPACGTRACTPSMPGARRSTEITRASPMPTESGAQAAADAGQASLPACSMSAGPSTPT